MCPRILQIYGPVWVNGYGLMIALGFLLFSIFAYCHPWRKKNLSTENFLSILFVGFLSAVIGGRLLFVLFEPPVTIGQALEIFYPWVGGFSEFGSVIGVIVGISFYLRKKQIPILPFFDLIGLYAPLLVAVSRIGCFLAGCCHGALVSASCWCSVTFTDPHGLAPLNVPLYPTQLYASAVSLCIFVILLLVEKYAKKIPGTIICLYLILASTSRFTLDFFRGDRGGTGITSMQWIVISLFMVGLIGLVIIRKRKHVNF